MSGAKQLVQKEIKDNFVMVFSKSYCPVSFSFIASITATDICLFTVLLSYQEALL
jgi:hypothetical protein